HQTLARPYYATTKDTPVTGTSPTTQTPDGFTSVPGTTRNVLAPGADVTTGTVGAETKAVAVADSVWTGDNLQVSPSAGFNGESNASQTGTLRNGTKRYLNLHQCNWRSAAGGDTSWVGNTTATAGFAGFQTGTNASNSADGTATSRPATPAAGFAVDSNASPAGALRHGANRYLNLHQCNWRSAAGGDTSWVGNTTATAGFAGFQTGTNASNSADGTVTCG